MGRFEVLSYEDTELGPLCLRRRELLSRPGEVVTEVTLNHEFLMSSYNTASERALGRLGYELHGGSGLRVLVGGLGLGYTARAALDGRGVAGVEVVELLPQVIGWLEQGLFPLAEELRADRRFEVCRGDVYGRLGGAGAGAYDVILIDVDHSPDERLGGESQEFYSSAGLALAKAHLAPGGVLGVWSYARSTPFAEAMAASFESLRVEAVGFDNDLIDRHTTDWLFFGRDGAFADSVAR
jgi:spermidine synthase